MHRFIALLAVVGILALVASARAEEGFSPYVGGDGSIRLPQDFRAEMVHLGSWFVPAGEASGFHDVYAERDAVRAFREAGAFPDGAVLVKELRPHASGDYTTGAGVSHATGDVKQWFVMVKDAEGRFPENPLWGDGWGWALFKPDDPARNVATDYRVDCLGCHAPARPKDFVYTEAYPTLAE